MLEPTCAETAELLMQLHNLSERAPKDYDEFTDVFSVVIEDLVFDHIKQLPDEAKFAIWYSCDDELDWMGGHSRYGDKATKSQHFEGLAAHAVYLTIAARIRPATTTV